MEKIRARCGPSPRARKRARWAAQAVERYLHMARIILSRAAAWAGPEAPFSPQVLDLAQQLYAVIARRVDGLERPPRPDVLCAYCGERPFLPYAPCDATLCHWRRDRRAGFGDRLMAARSGR